VPVRVDLVYPEVNASTRTTRVRLRFTGAHPPLRPGLYGEVFFAFGRRRALLVPRDALVDTGTQRYVFVDQGDGKYSPRLVVTGAEQQGRIEIRSGLASGERVVSGATFLIDAESRLQAAFSGLLAAPSASAPALPAAPAAPAPSPHDHRAHAAPPPAARAAASASATPAAPASTAPAAPPSAAPTPAVSESRYVCPMHPSVVSPTPGHCPICNMDLAKSR
jgi:Cu(I)/Ag(I) efflux system membrane fusion protein